MKNILIILVCFLFSSTVLKAQENVALSEAATATQSSDYGGLASKAIDGDTDGDYYKPNGSSLTHTNNDNGAWWQVDLGAVYDISTIKLYNRTDCCTDRLDNFTILVSETEMTDNSGGTAFATNESYTTNPVRTFSGDSRGRYVRVFLNGKNYLSLAEVEVFGDVSPDTNTQQAKTTIENTINFVLTYAQLGDVTINGEGINYTVSVPITLSGGTMMDTQAMFATDVDNSSVKLTGTFNNITIEELLHGMEIPAAMRNTLPQGFKNSLIDSFTMTIDPIEQQITGFTETSQGSMEISGKKGEGFMIGIKPNDLGNMIGVTTINGALSGFTLIYSSHTDEEDSPLDLLSDVKAQNGLNLYWTGRLPTILSDFLSFIDGITDEMTFSGAGTIEEGKLEIPEMSISLLRSYNNNPIAFENIILTLDPANAEIGLGGGITCNFGGGVPILGFQSSLTAKFSPLALNGLMSLNQIGNNPGTVWNNPFGIPHISITELFVGVEAGSTGVGGYLGGQAEFGSTNNKIAMELTIGSGPTFKATIDKLSIPAFYKAFSDSDMGVFEDILDIELTDAIVALNTTSKEIQFAGEANIFGLGSSFEVKSKNGNFSMEAEMDPLELKSGSTTLFGLTGETDRGGPRFDLNSNLSGNFTGDIELLGSETSSTITISPSEIRYEVNQSLFDSGLNADLVVTATNFIDLNNADFQLDATITNDLRSNIVGKVEDALEDVDPINFIGTVVNEALKTFEIRKIGFKTALSDFNKASINVTVDARLGTIKVPVDVTVNLEVASIERIATDVANEIANELKGVGSILWEGVEDLGKDIYEGGKVAIDWTEGAANTSAEWTEGAVAASGEWLKGAGSDCVSFFGGGGSSHTYDCSKSDFTTPSNGVSSGPAPIGIDQYRVTLQSITNIDRGDEGNDEHEIWGSIIIKTNMFMQENANPWLYNKSCRDATDCAFNVANTSISHYKDFFISSDLVATANFDIELILFEEDYGTDDPFEIKTLNIEYRNGMGFPLAPGQKRNHTIILEEEGYSPPQKIAVRLSIERIMEPPVYKQLIGVSGGILYTRNNLYSIWLPATNKTGNMIAVTYMNDGTILGVGTNHKLYTRATLNSNWVAANSHGDVKAVTQLRDGTILGVGIDNKLYTRVTLNSNWGPVVNKHGILQGEASVIAVTQLHDGTLLGVGTNHKLYTRATLNSWWVPVSNRHGSVIVVTQLYDGSILGVGTNHKLYTRATLNSNWVAAGTAIGFTVKGITTKRAPLKIGDTYGGGIVFYLARPGEDLNDDGHPDIGLVAAPTDESTGTRWSLSTSEISNLEEIVGPQPFSYHDLQFGFGASSTNTIVEDFVNSRGLAAKLCTDAGTNGFNDWFLPSIGELDLMYKTIGPGATGPNKNRGAFDSGQYYWSSTVGESPKAWMQSFTSGKFFKAQRTRDGSRVRSIRVISERTPKIGDYYAGGIIFYLAKPDEDLNGDGIPDIGLVAAPTDLSETDMEWSLTTREIPNLQKVTGAFPLSGQNLQFGFGASNTNTIAADYNTSKGTAAKRCVDLELNGSSDWFLPSIGELDLMYKNIGSAATGLNKNIGNFSRNYYWSSTVGNSIYAWHQSFYNGYQWSDNRESPRRVRAIRVF